MARALLALLAQLDRGQPQARASRQSPVGRGGWSGRAWCGKEAGGTLSWAELEALEAGTVAAMPQAATVAAVTVPWLLLLALVT